MANLLPLDTQKHVWRLYCARFVMALALAILALSFLLALALVPSYLALSLDAPPSSIQPGAHGTPGDPQVVARTQALIAQFLPLLSSTTSVSALISAATADRPSGATLGHIAYMAGEQGTAGQLLLVGNGSRDMVAAYRKSLKADAAFTTISDPVGALIGADDGSFSITMGGNF